MNIYVCVNWMECGRRLRILTRTSEFTKGNGKIIISNIPSLSQVINSMLSSLEQRHGAECLENTDYFGEIKQFVFRF